MNQKPKSNRQNKKKPTVILSESSSSEESNASGPPCKTPLTTTPDSSKTTRNRDVQALSHQASSEGKESRKSLVSSGKKATESVDIFAQFRGMKLTGKAKDEIQMAHSKNVANASKTLMRIRKNLQRQKEQQASNTHFKEVSKNKAVQNDGECALHEEEKTDKLKKNFSASAVLCNYPEQSYSDKNEKKKRNSQYKSTHSQLKKTDPLIKQAYTQIKKADPLIKKADPQIKKADPQFKPADSQVEKADLQIKKADPQIKQADLQIKKAVPHFEAADSQVENADAYLEMIDKLFEKLRDVESSDNQSEKFNKKLIKELYKGFEENLQRQIYHDACSNELSTKIFLKGLPIIEDIQFYKKLWEEMKTPFSFHGSICDVVNSVLENRNDISKTGEHTEALTPEAEIKNNLKQKNIFEYSHSKFQPVQDQISCVSENQTPPENVSFCEATEEFQKFNVSPERTLKLEDEGTCDSSSPDSQLKSDSSISNKPNFSEDSLSSSESSSGNSIITVVPANFRVPVSEIEAKLEQENISELSESKFQAVEDEISCVSNNLKPTGNMSPFETTAEFPKLDSSSESADFSINAASEETAQRLNLLDSSTCSSITTSDLDEDDSYSSLKYEDDNLSSSSSEHAHSFWRPDNQKVPVVERIYEDMQFNDTAAKIIDCYQWMYEVNILMQKVFDSLFKSADEILGFIFMSHPEAYMDKLLTYVSAATVLKLYNKKLQLDYQQFFNETENTESLYTCEDDKEQVSIYGRKGLFIIIYYSILKK